jgi:hypothetical protein
VGEVRVVERKATSDSAKGSAWGFFRFDSGVRLGLAMEERSCFSRRSSKACNPLLFEPENSLAVCFSHRETAREAELRSVLAATNEFPGL